MIWLLFKNCGRCKNKSPKSDQPEQRAIKSSKKVLQELLAEFDSVGDVDRCDGRVFVTDAHFACLSVVDPRREVNGSIAEIVDARPETAENGIMAAVDEQEDSIEAAMTMNKTRTKVTENHLKTLQCPFTWKFESGAWNTNVVGRIEKKYGKYNTDISSAVQFSFEK